MDVTKIQNRKINEMIHRMEKINEKALLYQVSLAFTSTKADITTMAY